MTDRLRKSLKTARHCPGFLCLIAISGLWVGSGASDIRAQETNEPEPGQVMLLDEDKETLEARDAAVPGTLILPEAPGEDTKGEKCMTVCARWGEDCLLINKGRGGMERKCRRTCKQFAEECF
jgi:hypothetical protein